MLYTLATEGSQNTDLGDRLAYNLAASYRISSDSHDHGHRSVRHQTWDLTLELNGEWTGHKKSAGVTDKDSGGNIVFISPGFRYTPPGPWSAHLSFGVPVISNPGKGHSDTEYKIKAGIARSF